MSNCTKIFKDCWCILTMCSTCTAIYCNILWYTYCISDIIDMWKCLQYCLLYTAILWYWQYCPTLLVEEDILQIYHKKDSKILANYLSVMSVRKSNSSIFFLVKLHKSLANNLCFRKLYEIIFAPKYFPDPRYIHTRAWTNVAACVHCCAAVIHVKV